MSKNNIISTYQTTLNRLNDEKISIDELQPQVRLQINEIKPPIAQLDEAISELTVEVNKKIETIYLVSTAAATCSEYSPFKR